MADPQASAGRPTPPDSPEDGKPTSSADIPCVGIFWFVMRAGRPELLTCMTPWPQAEDYGDFKTEATAHYEFWPKLRKTLRIIGEYEDWPRGRVVYNIDVLPIF